MCTRSVLVLLLLLAACADRKPSPPPRASAPDARPAPPPARPVALDAGVKPDAAPPPDPTRLPCGQAPEGMVCIPGGPFTRGSDRHGRNEKPSSTVVVSTFFIDAKEVTNPVYDACVKAGACARTKWWKVYRGFMGDTQPAVPVPWDNALATCLWLGKRLPTEAEWEKASRTTDGRDYPWGNEAPSCRRAHYQGCKPEVTKPVGSFPPNPYGVFDTGGNGYEWVMDLYTECYGGCKAACNADCAGPDPQGPCKGIRNCGRLRMRILRGGSWWWSMTHLRTTWRRGEYPRSEAHRLSFRCATRDPAPKPRTKEEVQRLLRELDTTPIPL